MRIIIILSLFILLLSKGYLQTIAKYKIVDNGLAISLWVNKSSQLNEYSVDVTFTNSSQSNIYFMDTVYLNHFQIKSQENIEVRYGFEDLVKLNAHWMLNNIKIFKLKKKHKLRLKATYKNITELLSVSLILDYFVDNNDLYTEISPIYYSNRMCFLKVKKIIAPSSSTELPR